MIKVHDEDGRVRMKIHANGLIEIRDCHGFCENPGAQPGSLVREPGKHRLNRVYDLRLLLIDTRRGLCGTMHYYYRVCRGDLVRLIVPEAGGLDACWWELVNEEKQFGESYLGGIFAQAKGGR